LEELLGRVAEGEDVLDELLLEVLVCLTLDDHTDHEVEELQQGCVVLARLGEDSGFIKTWVGHFEDFSEIPAQLLVQQFEASAWIGLS
jgi:hypothetical protein